MQRAMDFIAQQQAKYAGRLEKDEPRLAGLEESFKLLVELARRAHERRDTMATLRHNMNELAQSMIRLAEAQRRRESC